MTGAGGPVPVKAKALREALDRLSRLLADPHPGLATWCEMFGNRLADVRHLTAHALTIGVSYLDGDEP